jgi:hypothetical protein
MQPAPHRLSIREQGGAMMTTAAYRLITETPWSGADA